MERRRKPLSNDIDVTFYRTETSNAHTGRTAEEIRRIDALIYRYQKKKKRRRIFRLVLLLMVLTALYMFYKSNVRPPELADDLRLEQNVGTEENDRAAPSLSVNGSLRKDAFYTFVIVGMDDDNGNTDTIIIGALDVKNKKLNMVSIPRDTLVNVPWNPRKANTLLMHSDDGLDGFMRRLKDLTGFVPDSYFIVNLQAFVSLVDEIGGIEFDVPIDMDYEDPEQDLFIHIKAGLQPLDGEKALKVIRFRSGYPTQDIGRIETQQNLLKALAKKCLRLDNWDKIDDFAQIFRDNVETDLDLGIIIWYGRQIMRLKQEDIIFHTVPENYNDWVSGRSYCTILLDEWLEMINATINPFKEDIVIADVDILTRDENKNLYATTGIIACE
ncbi:MAG: LCP family protein [Clostridiales bacterium]|jgi:LCP family protein required for cell wall assembly|nr:LCP family protein [Clostridiales bacterium]